MTSVIPLDLVTEEMWQRDVVLLLKTLGYRCYHTHDSRRSQPGFPDLVAVRDRVIYLELKPRRASSASTSGRGSRLWTPAAPRCTSSGRATSST